MMIVILENVLPIIKQEADYQEEWENLQKIVRDLQEDSVEEVRNEAVRVIREMETEMEVEWNCGWTQFHSILYGFDYVI